MNKLDRQAEKEIYCNKAKMYASMYNINKYKIEDNRYLIYNVSYCNNIFNIGRRFTIQFKIDLESLQEVSRKPLKRFDKDGLLNGRR